MPRRIASHRHRYIRCVFARLLSHCDNSFYWLLSIRLLYVVCVLCAFVYLCVHQMYLSISNVVFFKAYAHTHVSHRDVELTKLFRWRREFEREKEMRREEGGMGQRGWMDGWIERHSFHLWCAHQISNIFSYHNNFISTSLLLLLLWFSQVYLAKISLRWIHNSQMCSQPSTFRSDLLHLCAQSIAKRNNKSH